LLSLPVSRVWEISRMSFGSSLRLTGLCSFPADPQASCKTAICPRRTCRRLKILARPIASVVVTTLAERERPLSVAS
jgi:hypothetical protein